MSGNGAALDALAGLASKLRNVGQVPEKAAPLVARALESVLQRQIAAGRDPDGKAWPLTQDGRQPMRDAAQALTVTARGPVVVATLRGPEALHSKGQAAGGVRRAILPTRKMPQAAVTAVREVIGKVIGNG